MKRYLCKAAHSGMERSEYGNWVARQDADEIIGKLVQEIIDLKRVTKNARKNVLFLQDICNRKQLVIDNLQNS